MGLAAADGDFTGQFLLRLGKFPFRFIGQFHNLLCAPPQKHSCVGQDDPVLAAAKELSTQFLLQLHQLSGKSGLGHMEQRRCFRNILLLCHS